MNYYAPMQMYIILAIGVACHSIVLSRLVPRDPPSDKDYASVEIDPVLLMIWMPLVLYQIGLFFGMSPETLPYHDVPNSATRFYMQIAHAFHAIAVCLFPFWTPFSFIVRLRNKMTDQTD